MSRPPGVWVCGPSRSGTSMVAGLLAQHGVFYGACRRPTPENEKGFFENNWLKLVMKRRISVARWPDAWWEQLQLEGWDMRAPWGCKTGAERAPLILPMNPAVIVACRRPLSQIVASRERTSWARGGSGRAAKRSYNSIADLQKHGRTTVVEVRTDRLVQGDLQEVRRAFPYLGLQLDEKVAEEWIDPKLWHHHGK